MKRRYEVVVGNIGTVYDGTSKAAALKAYGTYVRQSKSGRGRAGGEDVTVLSDGDIIKEHYGSNAQFNPRSRRKNPTKAQKREASKKASAKRRVAVALAKFLKQANPAGKYAGATMRRNKGGSITIVPIKVRRAK